MKDDQLLRYSRHILLPAVGVDGQERLLAARALIVGAGGLGSPAALYLAGAGVGHLVIADPDTVELTNLQRQILHGQADIGRNKTESARERLHALNPDIRITALPVRLDGEALSHEVAAADVIIDASDNFATRFAVNAACVQHRKPLVSGAAIRMEAQLAVFRADLGDGPCYRCLYGEGTEVDQTCSENGVLAPLVGVIGSLQAVEAIKVLLGIGDDMRGRLLLYDAAAAQWRTITLRHDPQCPVCA